jgi:hypothetical protein
VKVELEEKDRLFAKKKNRSEEVLLSVCFSQNGISSKYLRPS